MHHSNCICILMLFVFFLPYLDNVMEDMDVDLEKEFLHDLKDLKVLVNDKDMLDQHKRHANNLFRWSLCNADDTLSLKYLSLQTL